MAEAKRARTAKGDKKAMRTQLEKVLEIQTELGKRMDAYQRETEVEEYYRFWDEIRRKNDEMRQRVSRYMVTKCNR